MNKTSKAYISLFPSSSYDSKRCSFNNSLLSSFIDHKRHQRVALEKGTVRISFFFIDNPIQSQKLEEYNYLSSQLNLFIEKKKHLNRSLGILYVYYISIAVENKINQLTESDVNYSYIELQQEISSMEESLHYLNMKKEEEELLFN